MKKIWYTFVIRLIGLLYQLMMLILFIIYLIPMILSKTWRNKTLPLFHKELHQFKFKKPK